MNVLYLQDKPSGGAGESLYQMLRARDGHGKSVVAFGARGFVGPRFDALRLAPEPKYLRMFPWLRASVPRSPIGLARLGARLAVDAATIARLCWIARRERIDLVHTNCISVIEGAITAKLLRLPHVWHVRELLDLDYYSFNISKQRLASRLSSLSSLVLCNSKRTAVALEGLGVRRSKLRVVYNFVDRVEQPADLREKLGLGRDVQIVATVGWVTPNKRVEDFIDLASRMRDLGDRVRFVIIGGWGYRPDYNERIRRLIDASPNGGRILHTGVLPDASSYMASIDLLVCPCWTESFGRTVAEAMSAGTPAIGVSGSAVEEIIDHGVSGFLVARGDTVAIERHVRELLASPTRRREFGNRARLAIAERFSSSVGLPRLQAAYAEALGVTS